MALKINFNLCEGGSCDELTFTELTGAYDATTNDGGWGNPNPEIGDAESVELVITYPDGSSSDPIDLSSLFPSTNKELELIIDATDVGLTKFPDGVYTVTYTVVVNDGGEVTYSKTCYFFFDCSAQCCVDKLFAKVKTTDCKDCKNSKLDFAVEAQAYLTAARSAVNCGNIATAKENLKKVQYMCNLEKCKSC